MMKTKSKKVTFFINNLAYTIELNTSPIMQELEKELLEKIPQDNNIDTKTLFSLYVQQITDTLMYKKELDKLIAKFEKYDQKS